MKGGHSNELGENYLDTVSENVDLSVLVFSVSF